ncbi:hypothetical protein HK102_001751 [Quaeritorhiza haematococci]|nr:hypothetical protein HK102_001751 [Quaeritorhiza haematococci]
MAESISPEAVSVATSTAMTGSSPNYFHQASTMFMNPTNSLIAKLENQKNSEKQQLIITLYQKHLSDFTNTPDTFLKSTTSNKLFTNLETVAEWQSKLNRSSLVTRISSQIFDVALSQEFRKDLFIHSTLHLVCMHAIEISYLSFADKSVAKVKAIANFCHEMANQFTVAKNTRLKESFFAPRLKETIFLNIAQLFQEAADKLKGEQHDFRYACNDVAYRLLNIVHLVGEKLYNLGIPLSRHVKVSPATPATPPLRCQIGAL